MAELKKTSGRTNEFKQLGHGSYVEIVQDEFLDSVTKSKYVICHFYHQDFERCKIVDKHLELLAQRHLATKFVKLNAEKAPFFIGKLNIKMLPTIVLFKDGIAVDRIVGFDELGETDDFPTSVMEKRIAKAGVLISGEDDDEEDKKRLPRTNIRVSNRTTVQGDSSEDESD